MNPTDLPDADQLDAARNPAPALELELHWLADCLAGRLQHYFARDALASAGPPWQLPPPPALPPGSAYADLVHALQLHPDERLILALALAPLLRPPLLDVLLSRNDSTQRPFTEFGGHLPAEGTHNAPLQPTGETVAFLLAGDALGPRLAALQQLQPEGRLARGDLVQLLPAAPGALPASGALQLSPRLAAVVLPHFGEWAGLPALAPQGLPAQRLHTGLQWHDLVLPAATLAQLQDIELWLAHGATLLHDWGLGRRISPGYTALFHGPPGTGKTLSACLLGQHCGREVWRVDLSQVVSKYIGETEKNLARLFDRAQSQGWILFFDEADALFGKRTAVSDAHDRYANQEVSYLLQRIETFEGVCILASNLRHHIDEAFARRFQCVLAFSVPDAADRERLWREAFPAQVTLEPAVDLAALAQAYEISGGTIMNVVRHACLRSLGRGEAVIQRRDVVEGIRRELLKEGRVA